jgi:UDP-2,4-diacetamido-2,4,6-trideoxy-beta-L-altropyranose hydrolase
MMLAHNIRVLSLRSAAADDARLLWEWANDPFVRVHAFTPEAIPWETHLHWYANRLASDGTRFWLLEDAGTPVAQIRYDRNPEGTEAEISFSVARDHRGKGLGTEIVRQTCKRAVAELGVEQITALVFPENLASMRTFEKVGFIRSGLIEVRGRTCYRFVWQLAHISEKRL